MLNPSMQELMKRVGNRYLLVNLAAQRARDIADEAEQSGVPLTDKAVKLALDEIAAGEIVYRPGPRVEPIKTANNPIAAAMVDVDDDLDDEEYGKGISGLQYQAISYGPVPVRYSTIYENLDGLKKEIINLGNGYSGSMITTVEQFEQSLFTVEELEVLQCVLVHFEKSKANEISEMSHAEEAWRQNEKQHSLIDYSYAFDLRQL